MCNGCKRYTEQAGQAGDTYSFQENRSSHTVTSLAQLKYSHFSFFSGPRTLNSREDRNLNICKMISMLENIKSLKKLNKDAIIMCNEDKILETQTFEYILHASEQFEQLFSEHLKMNNLCIGLIMKHNIYLPSIILSLQKFNHTFVYINRKKVDGIKKENTCDYVLSLAGESISLCEKITEINIRDYTFILWRSRVPSGVTYSLNNIFCVVHTSGTTGLNKTIRIPSNCIKNNAVSLGKMFQIRSEDIIFWGTPLSFDPSLIELLLGFLNGATLVMVPENTYVNPQALFSALFNVAHVSIIQMVPSIFYRWDDYYIEKILCATKLRILAFGGEAFPKSVLRFKRNKTLKLFNVYGISELSCWATVHQVDEETVEDELPIGTDLEDTIVEVRGENGEVVKEGFGEIFIGSETRRCYIDNEIDSLLPLFRETGDLAYIENGKIFYRGRKNKIVKRYGHRVNLMKIESVIFEKCDLTTKCIWSENHSKLLTFILIKDIQTKTAKEKILDKIRSKLFHVLEEHSFPDYLEILQSFPITCHGKIDERQLEEYYIRHSSSLNYKPVDLFCNLWCKYLGMNINDSENFDHNNFFEMGGSSITILQLISEFREYTDIKCTELDKAIFTMKFSDCKNVISKMQCRFEKINSSGVPPKRPRLEECTVMEILWKYDLKACVDGSPLVFTLGKSKRISVGSFCSIFSILDECGSEIFKHVLDGPIESTPTLSPCQRFIYIGCYDGTMYCINISTQQIVWKFKTGDKIKSSALCFEDGGRILFGSYDRYVYCLSSKDGSLVWKKAVDGNIASNLNLHDDFVLLATTKGTCYSILNCKGDINWTFNCGSPVFGTPCILRKHEQIVVPSVLGTLFCLSLSNCELVWKFQSDGHIFSSLFVFNDHIAFGSHDKNVYVLKISARDSILVGKIELNSEISSTPCIYQNEDFVRIVAATNVGTIYSVDFTSFSVLKEVKLPGEVFSSPFVHEDKIYVGCRDNNLYCLSLE